MKAIQSEIKKNIQGTNSGGKEKGTQISDLEQKEEINIQQGENEETLIFLNSVVFRHPKTKKKNGPNERTDQSPRKNTTKQ